MTARDGQVCSCLLRQNIERSKSFETHCMCMKGYRLERVYLWAKKKNTLFNYRQMICCHFVGLVWFFFSTWGVSSRWAFTVNLWKVMYVKNVYHPPSPHLKLLVSLYYRSKNIRPNDTFEIYNISYSFKCY